MNYNVVLEKISQIDDVAQRTVARNVNQLLTLRNWLIGAYIFEYEQNGEDRAVYGEQLLKKLSDDLSKREHKGLSFSNLKNFRQFALAYPKIAISQTLSGQFDNLLPIVDLAEIEQTQTTKINAPYFHFPCMETRHSQKQNLSWQDDKYFQRLFSSLSWSHLLELCRIDEPLKRAFYELESMKSRWSLRELKRQMNSMLYERVGLSKDKDAVMALTSEGQLTDSPKTILRDPYVLEFIGLEKQAAYSESQLEQALIDHLQEFLHELGRDFCFMDRQYRITVAGQHYFLDLLFYHRKLRCLIAIDLKLGAFSHQDAGQMNFYLNYLKDQVAYPDENAPIGIILCAEKDAEEAHYATAGLDKNLFVSQYLIKLPSEEQLKQWLRDEQVIIERLMDK
jgi:predicted nuclease of restriction endonuclease-like (RecB) superfamily